LPRTRNRGLELARGEYFASLDSDDYACPDRLRKQVDFLDRHPDVAVVGVPDADMGKLVLAVVELRPGERATADEIIAFARRDLAHYKCPRRVEIVDHLPREPHGKIKKHELVTRYSGSQKITRD